MGTAFFEITDTSQHARNDTIQATASMIKVPQSIHPEVDVVLDLDLDHPPWIITRTWTTSHKMSKSDAGPQMHALQQTS